MSKNPKIIKNEPRKIKNILIKKEELKTTTYDKAKRLFNEINKNKRPIKNKNNLSLLTTVACFLHAFLLRTHLS